MRFRLSNYVTKIDSKSYQNVLRAIVDGECDPEKLVGLVHGRTVNKHGLETVKAAMTGSFSDIDLPGFRQTREMMDLIETQIEECQKVLTAHCEASQPS